MIDETVVETGKHETATSDSPAANLIEAPCGGRVPTPSVSATSRRTRLLHARAAVSEGTDLLRAKAKSLREAIGEVVKSPGEPESELNVRGLFAQFMEQQSDLAAAKIVLDSLKDESE